MLYLNLNEIRTGMALGRDLFDTQGRRLLPADCVLTEEHLRLLRTHQITRVPIAPMQAWDGGDALAIDGFLEARFGLCDRQHPLVYELQRLCRQRIIRTEGGTGDDEHR
ncbi:MAG: hypothetical protein ABR553_06235 [Gammaproteobacteria bacterium]